VARMHSADRRSVQAEADLAARVWSKEDWQDATVPSIPLLPGVHPLRCVPPWPLTSGGVP